MHSQMHVPQHSQLRQSQNLGPNLHTQLLVLSCCLVAFLPLLEVVEVDEAALVSEAEGVRHVELLLGCRACTMSLASLMLTPPAPAQLMLIIIDACIACFVSGAL